MNATLQEQRPMSAHERNGQVRRLQAEIDRLKTIMLKSYWQAVNTFTAASFRTIEAEIKPEDRAALTTQELIQRGLR